jgi:hypothetical protein
MVPIRCHVHIPHPPELSVPLSYVMASAKAAPSDFNRLLVAWALVVIACSYGYLQDVHLTTPVGKVGGCLGFRGKKGFGV